MKMAVVGFGVEGKEAYRHWQAQGAQIVIHDANEQLLVPKGAKAVLGEHYLEGLDDYDLVFRSAGVKPWLISTKAPITTTMIEFFARCPSRIIGVTGTKGKGTTTTLIARILGEAGWRTHVGGNIGQSPLSFLSRVRANHLVVLELSSFQLMDLNMSPHIAVCLMIASEHMDWHRNMREYVAAKGNIFWHQHEDDLAVYYADNEYSADIAQLSKGRKLPYMQDPGAYVRDDMITIGGEAICRRDEVGLIGPHNLQNICAAITATWDLVKHNSAPIQRAVTSFSGLEHRIEFVREAGRVKYYDDSFATTPETVIAAIASFEQPKVLVLGGSEKNSNYDELARVVAAGGVRNAILIGDTGSRILTALNKAGFRKAVMGPSRMVDIVASARGLAEPGDVVLLSPGCASFGLFRNYKDRGDQFKAAVTALAD